MRGRLVPFVVLAAVVGVVSGCGGGSSSSDQTAKFKKGYEPVRVQFQLSGSAIGTAIQQAKSHTDAQLLVTFRGLAARWQSQVSRLETLKPPDKVAADFNTLRDAATRVESDLKAVVSAAGTHSAAAARQASAGIVTDFLAVRSADSTLKRKLGLKS